LGPDWHCSNPFWPVNNASSCKMARMRSERSPSFDPEDLQIDCLLDRRASRAKASGHDVCPQIVVARRPLRTRAHASTS
jgi:hypothetical protein